MNPYDEINSLPERLSESEVLYWLDNREINWTHLNLLKEYSSTTDQVISGWLNISVRTLRNYRKPDSKIKDNIKEHLLLLLSLYKHGINIFGSADSFNEWLNGENFFFDGEAPSRLLHTISGIRFVDSRLTGMEYGDNA
ncbi:MAG: MbcA/ParS/Xre antitoxin family protein [Bacteroidota bacterium]